MKTDKTSNYSSVDKFALQRVLADKSIPPGAKVILFNLIYRLGGKDYSFPSQKRIAAEVGLGERQVRNLLKKLKNKGIIYWRRKAFNPKTKKFVNSNSYDLSNLLTEE